MSNMYKNQTLKIAFNPSYLTLHLLDWLAT